MRKRARGRWRWLLLAVLLGGGLVAWTAGQRHPVFVVEVIWLAECPDHLRAAAGEILAPLAGKTFFEVRARSEEVTERLRNLAEVAEAHLECRPPNVVEARLIPRVPTLALKVGERWLNVDSEGVVVRVSDRPEAGLPRVYGLRSAVGVPGAVVGGSILSMATDCVRATRQVLGSPPVAMTFEPGGGLRVRTAEGRLVLLGRAVDLEDKLRVYATVRDRLEGPARYYDVSAPSAPAWLPGG